MPTRTSTVAPPMTPLASTPRPLRTTRGRSTLIVACAPTARPMDLWRQRQQQLQLLPLPLLPPLQMQMLEETPDLAPVRGVHMHLTPPPTAVSTVTLGPPQLVVVPVVVVVVVVASVVVPPYQRASPQTRRRIGELVLTAAPGHLLCLLAGVEAKVIEGVECVCVVFCVSSLV